MPFYDYECKKCNKIFDEMVSIAKVDKFKASCPDCKSKKTQRLISKNISVSFTNPQDTSKWDSFEYRAGFNMEKAKAERRAAEAAQAQDNPYQNWGSHIDADLNNDANWGKPK